MILYSAYLALLSIFLLNVGLYFDSAFTAIGVGVGIRTAVIQIATLLVVGVILMIYRVDKAAWRELWASMALWMPFLLYLAFRVDSANPYSETKFMKIVLIVFLSVLTVTMTYFSDPRRFLRLLPIVVIAFSLLLGIEALVNPQQFMYRTVIDRMTVEGMNPIWLARSFALAGVCLFLLPMKNAAVKLIGLVLVTIGILPTGSRGPLISLMLILAVWFVVSSDRAGIRSIILVMSAGVIGLSALLFAGDRIETVVDSYFSRGQHQGFVEESGRPELFARAVSDFMSSPVVGVGLGAFGQSAVRGSNVRPKNSSNQGFYPHNMVMELLSELGIIGIILATVAMRPGKWLLDLRNPYYYPFALSMLFAMTSGDVNANIGVFVLGTVARITSDYPIMGESPEYSELLEMDSTT